MTRTRDLSKMLANRQTENNDAARPTGSGPQPAGETRMEQSDTYELQHLRSSTVRRSGPRFTSFTAKTARLRPQQVTELHLLTTRLQAAKTSTVERITDNTLLRIAVDLLLTRAGELGGSTEEELRSSLGLAAQ